MCNKLNSPIVRFFWLLHLNYHNLYNHQTDSEWLPEKETKLNVCFLDVFGLYFRFDVTLLSFWNGRLIAAAPPGACLALDLTETWSVQKHLVELF